MSKQASSIVPGTSDWMHIGRREAGLGIAIVGMVLVLPASFTIGWLTGTIVPNRDPTVLVVIAAISLAAPFAAYGAWRRARYFANRPILVVRGVHPDAVRSSVVEALAALGYQYAEKAHIIASRIPLIYLQYQLVVDSLGIDIGINESADAKLGIKTVEVTIGGWSDSRRSEFESLKREIPLAIRRTIALTLPTPG